MDWIRARTSASPNSYKYRALSGDDHFGQNGKPTRENMLTDRKKSVLKVTVGGLIVAIVLFFVIGHVLSGSDDCDSPRSGYQCRADISHSWGQYSPFYSIRSEIDRKTPDGCNITFAQILSRHGARDPTLSKTITYGALIERIQSIVTDYGSHCKFIKNYRYTLGADQLTRFGEQQMVNSGIKFYKRYAQLASTETPFVRSAGQYRVVVSAQNWTQGFHRARIEDKHADGSDGFPYNMVIIPEDPGFNNSLSHDLCTAFEDGPYSKLGHEAQTHWVSVFAPPITDRLNQNLPGANLTDEDTVSFMDLCPFNTVAHDHGKLSPFCNLFSRDEWHAYDYYQSVGKWYGYGDGNPLGPTQGVGFVNELIARLTSKPVKDHTSTNSTLDGSADTFPLGKVLYADFSHDNDMAGIYAALGLYNETRPLWNDTKVPPGELDGYAASWTVPFAARMYVEKMSCRGFDEEFVRILVNDRVIPLKNCSADELGRCKLSRFVDSLSFVRAGGHWDQCFEE